jgi:hypothetical protein
MDGGDQVAFLAQQSVPLHQVRPVLLNRDLLGIRAIEIIWMLEQSLPGIRAVEVTLCPCLGRLPDLLRSEREAGTDAKINAGIRARRARRGEFGSQVEEVPRVLVGLVAG